MRNRPFYGWLVVASAFMATMLGFGSAYTFSVFLGPLEQAFGLSRGTASLVFSLAGFLYFALGSVTGPLADRWGARRLVVGGMILTGAGLIAAGLARSALQVCLGYGLGVGLGIGCSYVPAVGAVQRWFVRRRGFASGLAVSGIGVGTLLMPPLATALIGTVGWRHAYIALGALVIVVGPATTFLIANDPRDRGLQPDGLSSPRPVRHETSSSMREAVRSAAFIRLYVSCFVCSFGVFVPFVDLVPSALGRGVPPKIAALLLGVIGVGSTAGRFMLGGLADRLGRQTALVTMLVGMALALPLWMLGNGAWSIGGFAFLYGVFYGGWVAVLPAVVMDRFGGRNVSGPIGILYTSVAFGTLIGPSAAGYAFDATRSYTVPILAAIAANIAAAAIAGIGVSQESRARLPP